MWQKWEERNTCGGGLREETGENKILGRPRLDRNGLKEVGWEGVEWIHLAQNRGKCAGC